MPMQLPQVEIVTDAPGPVPASTSWWDSHRVLLYLGVFLATLVIGQLLNFSRATVYRSSATVLTVAPSAVDEPSLATDLDLQHVEIQRRFLLGQPLLKMTLERLQQAGQAETFGLEQIADFEPMLSVSPIPSTHLVQLSAEGPQPELLQHLVNSWIDAYLGFREQAVRSEVGETTEALNQQYRELGERLEEKRGEMETFRKRHAILTEGRTENRAHAKLQGLNQSLNKAREAEVSARARLNSIQAAIERNEPVVPESEKRNLVQLQTQAAGMRDKLKRYEKLYTPEYRLVEPLFQELPQQLAAVEKAIQRSIEEGRKLVLTDARQEMMSTAGTALELERQLRVHEKEVTEFTARFAEYEAMVEDLNALEELYRNTEQRRVQIESRSLEKYPQVKVVDWADLPTTPLHPHYLRDAAIIFAAALVLGVMAVWLVEYLRRTEETPYRAGGLAGIRIFSREPPLEASPDAPSALADNRSPTLAAPMPRELTAPEIEALWRVADTSGKRLIGLLLSGLTLEEIMHLTEQDFDPAVYRLHVNGRLLTLPSHLCTVLQSSGTRPATASDPDALEADLKLLAYDAGLPYPEALNTDMLRHSYILFLVRQGARLRELEQIIGPMSPQALMAYGPYSPKGAGKPLDDLELYYPVESG